MAVTINGTTGIAGVDGSNTTPAIKGGTSTGTGVFYGTNTVSLATGGTTAVTVDSSQRVGIGTTTPNVSLVVGTNYGSFQGTLVNLNGANNAQANGTGMVTIASTSATAADTGGSLGFAAYDSGLSSPYPRAVISGRAETGTAGNYTGYFAVATSNGAGTIAERLRVDSSGNLLVGTTNSSNTAGIGVKIRNIGTNGTVSVVGDASTNSADTYHVYSTSAAAYRFYVEYGGTVRATVTSISGISDISLKENIRDLETGLHEILRLKPRRFDWREETKLGVKNVAGFIAQEVETVLPDLVLDGKYSDTVNKKFVKMGDMLPTLVKAIQELSAKLDAAEARIAALEAK